MCEHTTIKRIYLTPPDIQVLFYNRDVFMRAIQKWIPALFLLVFSGHIYGISIAYDGFECKNNTNYDDPAASNTPAQSRFDIIEAVDGEIYRLRLTGGLPRFSANNRNVCIDNLTGLGFSGVPNVDGIPKVLDETNATAYFDGVNLIIMVNSIHTDLSARRGTFSSFNTSHVTPFSNTLIFDYDAEKTTFKLKKAIQNRGLVHTSGSTGALIPFLETILPTFDSSTQDKSRILTPTSNIEYRLE